MYFRAKVKCPLTRQMAFWMSFSLCFLIWKKGTRIVWKSYCFQFEFGRHSYCAISKGLHWMDILNCFSMFMPSQTKFLCLFSVKMFIKWIIKLSVDRHNVEQVWIIRISMLPYECQHTNYQPFIDFLVFVRRTRLQKSFAVYFINFLCQN